MWDLGRNLRFIKLHELATERGGEVEERERETLSKREHAVKVGTDVREQKTTDLLTSLI